MKPIVAIVGRPNVGKSTLFNRFTGGRTAIVEDTPGVTRDRLYRDAEWSNIPFTVIDTGGLEINTEDTILSKMKQQAQIAIEEADVILFVVDGKTGLTADDQEVGLLLRKTKKEVLLVVNKIEDFSNPAVVYEFYQLGLGDPLPISAIHGMNTGDLLDRLIELFPKDLKEPYEKDVIKITVAGRPNVGKSSLVNYILGQERVIVTDIPGTTRDAIDTPFTRNEQDYVIIDTAGMRRKGRIDQPTERYSVIRSLRSIERCDVALLILDATEGLTDQDKRIAGYIHEQGKGCIIVVNKWDLIEKDGQTLQRFEREVRSELQFMKYAPLIFISALTGQRVAKILEIVDFVAEQQSHKVRTSVLNQVLIEAMQVNPPPTDKGRRLRIYYITQVSIKPPTFILFLNEPDALHFSYERFLDNSLREAFGFEGTPIRFIKRKRKE